jgi:hypothetical protein
MPEVISKHPDVTIAVLRGAGARCGEGAPQTILTACPADRFCSTPTGEICVFGLDEVPRMTQISPAEIVRAVSVPGKGGQPTVVEKAAPGADLVLAVSLALLAGLLLGMGLARRYLRRKAA